MSDIIQKTIIWKSKFENEKFNYQTWEMFDNVSFGKKIYLFGIGVGTDFFFYKFPRRVEGIIDNDKNKVNKKVEKFSYIPSEYYEYGLVRSVEDWSSSTKKDAVILITNLKYCEDIAKQLDKLGFHNYYSLLAMEKNRRQKLTSDEIEADNPYNIEYVIDEKKLFFYTMNGYSGHGKYIAEKILNKRMNLDIVWAVNDLDICVPKGIRLISSQNRMDLLREMSSAKIWVHDDMVPTYIPKKENQIYIQVKHWSSVTLKTFGFDLANFRNDEEQKQICEHNSRLIDYIITGSKFDTRTCRSGFGFDGKIVELGSARSDVLFEVSARDKVFSHYGIDYEKKILLYAPTFRSIDETKYNPKAIDTHINYDDIREALCRYSQNDWIIMLRLHPVVAKQSDTVYRPEYVIDGSDYLDSQELVAACDMMITDYSSIMFEPAFVHKPVFLYAPDRGQYIDGERGLLIPYDELPFPIAETNEKLSENIINFNKEQYEKDIDEFFDKYGVHEDGHASDRGAEFICNLIDGKVKQDA